MTCVEVVEINGRLLAAYQPRGSRGLELFCVDGCRPGNRNGGGGTESARGEAMQQKHGDSGG